MKRLSAFARSASRSRSCSSRWKPPSLDQPRRQLATSQSRRQHDDGRRKAEDSAFLPSGELNPKYTDRRLSKKTLPEGWEKVISATPVSAEDPDAAPEEAHDGETDDIEAGNGKSDEIEQFRAILEESAMETGDFNGPGDTNVYGFTEEEMKAIERYPDLREEKYEEGFFAEGEEKEDPGEDPEFEADDITSQAHAELEQHRELREMARAIVWDMPLLWNHRKDFKPPTSETPLRFRYTTYLGELHPASRKVVLDFRPSELPDLTPVQLSKFIKILGARYNPSTENAKMSCEMFQTAAQNKRYLGDLVDKLLTEARDPKDTFEDVPFDFRHHKPRKTRPEFPEHWKMTQERRAYLDRKRQEQAQIASEDSFVGEVSDGGEGMKQLPGLEGQEEPVFVRAGQELSPLKS